MISYNEHLQPYIDFLLSMQNIARPLTIVCDCSNGPTGLVVNALSKQLGDSVTLIIINDTLDPEFGAHGPDPTNQNALTDARKVVLEHHADFGVIFDGDGDRAVFINEKGDAIPSHVIAAFMISNIRGKHVADALVYEALIHSDTSLTERLIPSQVGRYYINNAMHEHQAVMGAEFSGHYYFADFWNADSGVITMIKVANFLSREKVTTSEVFKKYSNHYIGADKIKTEDSFETITQKISTYVQSKKAERTSTLDGYTVDFGTTWINVRPSNTEPIIRITAGASTQKEMLALVAEYKNLLS